MPRTPRPRAGEDAEHGTGAALERMAGTVRASSQPLDPRQPDAGPVPEIDPEDALTDPNEPSPDEPDVDLNGGLDEVLFGPTRRPDEPQTQGAPFGAGANFVALPWEDQNTFIARVAQSIEESPGGSALSAYTARMRRGE